MKYQSIKIERNRFRVPIPKRRMQVTWAQVNKAWINHVELSFSRTRKTNIDDFLKALGFTEET